MANKNTSKTRRRPSKAELERKEAIQRMLISLGIALLLIFAAFKLGAAGITLYNLIRLLVGSLAYLAIFGILLYLFFFKWIRKQEGLLSGFFTIFAGLLLIFEAYAALCALCEDFRDQPVRSHGLEYARGQEGRCDIDAEHRNQRAADNEPL